MELNDVKKSIKKSRGTVPLRILHKWTNFFIYKYCSYELMDPNPDPEKIAGSEPGFGKKGPDPVWSGSATLLGPLGEVKLC
jgi:hypothetical protein